MVLNVDESLKNEEEISQKNPFVNECLNSNTVQKICRSKRRIIRNAVVLSSAYFLFFTGFWAISNLQSTMNSHQGIGVYSQAVVYLCSMISCFFPELLFKKFGTKTTYVISLLLGCLYFAANFIPRWDTMMVSSVIYGMVSGPRNAALCVYLNEMSAQYETASGECRENATVFFFGLFIFFTEFSHIIGNIVSYYILVKGNNLPPNNFSVVTECGIHFDLDAANNGTNTNLDPPSDHQRYLVCGIFLTFGLLAVVDAIFLDPLDNDMKEIRRKRSVSQSATRAIRQLKNPNQVLLLPLTIFLGIEFSFYSADFTQAFIACSWGVYHVGFVTIFFGVCGSLTGIFVGPLVKYISLMSIIVLVAVIHGVACVLLFVWQPSPDAPVAYFIFAGVWGVTDAVMWSQMGALYSLMFPNEREAAFSNFYFWSYSGCFLCYIYADYLAVSVKITVMLVFLIVGVTLYVIGQIKIKCFSLSDGT